MKKIRININLKKRRKFCLFSFFSLFFLEKGEDRKRRSVTPRECRRGGVGNRDDEIRSSGLFLLAGMPYMNEL